VPIVSSIAVDGYGHVHGEDVQGREEGAHRCGLAQAGSHEIWAHAEHEARIIVAGKDTPEHGACRHAG